MILGFYKTSGHSMSPKIKSGSFFIASSIPFKFRSAKKGDIILFKTSNQSIVKRIDRIKEDRFYLKGDNKLDSKNYLPISKKEIIAKVLWVF
jgi:phage repressor protein C with HTH and peptisase S24 domain